MKNRFLSIKVIVSIALVLNSVLVIGLVNILVFKQSRQVLKHQIEKYYEGVISHVKDKISHKFSLWMMKSVVRCIERGLTNKGRLNNLCLSHSFMPLVLAATLVAGNAGNVLADYAIKAGYENHGGDSSASTTP